MKLMITDRRSAWLFGVASALTLTQWLVVATWPAGDVAPLHYTIYFGIDLTGPDWQLYIVPAASTMAVIFHLVVSRLQTSTLWSRVWAITAVSSTVLLSAALTTLRYIVTK